MDECWPSYTGEEDIMEPEAERTMPLNRTPGKQLSARRCIENALACQLWADREVNNPHEALQWISLSKQWRKLAVERQIAEWEVEHRNNHGSQESKDELYNASLNDLKDLAS
jgi:hypothetical protein